MRRCPAVPQPPLAAPQLCPQTPGFKGGKYRVVSSRRRRRGPDRGLPEAKSRGPAHHQPPSGALSPTPGQKTVNDRSRLPHLPGWRPIVKELTTGRKKKQPYLNSPSPEEEKGSAWEFKGQIYCAGQEVTSEPEAWRRECRHVVRTLRSLLTWAEMHRAATLYGSQRASAPWAGTRLRCPQQHRQTSCRDCCRNKCRWQRSCEAQKGDKVHVFRSYGCRDTFNLKSASFGVRPGFQSEV